MIIDFNGTEPIVVDAVERSNYIINNPDFYEGIRNHPGFDYSSAKPGIIAQLIHESTLTFLVELYRGRRNSRVLGYVTASSPNRLFLNGRKLNRRVETIVATIIHESVHAVDHSIKEYYFGHKGNRSRGNQNTAPYWIGNLAKELAIGSALQLAMTNASGRAFEVDIEEDILDAVPLMEA